MKYAIAWHHGVRQPLRELFEVAEDSPEQLEGYIDLGRVLIAIATTAEIIGHLQLVPTDQAGVVEIKNLAVRNRLRSGGLSSSKPWLCARSRMPTQSP